LLDIGCGTGTQCNDLSSSVNHVIGIDISRKLLAIAEQRKAERVIENVEFINATIFDERFNPASFDMVMAFYVLHFHEDPASFDMVMAFYVLHFHEDIDEVFRRIHRLLKPGGLFVSETACMADKDVITGKVVRIAGKLGFLPLINLLSTQQNCREVRFPALDQSVINSANGAGTSFGRLQCCR
jgi:ubiquinone/menaquinone biosynthesis C-methylase UbiE